jgi:DNA-binding beta-propeller fold protein YncE
MSPNGIAIDGEGNVYVSESGNHRVQKFTSEGDWLATRGSRGSGDGEFLSAMVIAADDDNKLYVSDWGNGRVQVFDTDGNFLAELGVEAPATAN